MKKIILIATLAALFVCVFVLTVGAAGAVSDGYGDITVIDGETEPSVIDADARVVILASDGTYYTFPSYYILNDSETFGWRKNDNVYSILGYSGKSASDIRGYIVRMELPEGLVALNPNNGGGANVFEDAKIMAEIKLPSTLTIIGDHTFNRCYKLAVIDGLLEYLAKDTTTRLGAQMVAETLWGEGVDLVIPAGVTSIPDRCFYGTKINSVTFHDGITSLGGRAFQQCANITEIKLPASLTIMKNHVFAGCSKLTAVDTSACTGLTSIGEYCFEKTDLTAFDFTPFASSLTSVDYGMFNVCKKLANVTGYELCDGLTEVKTNMFNQCPLTTITFPKNITAIGDYAYAYHRSNQTEIRIPNGVTSIGNHAFVRDTVNATPAGVKIYLPASLTTVTGTYNFEYWDYAEMYLPAGFNVTQGFTNGTLASGAVYFYTGDKDTLTINNASNHNSALLNAEWISVNDFKSASDSKNYIVYGVNHCDAFYGGVHAMTGEATMQKVDYLAGVFFVDSCARAKCGVASVDNSLTIDPLFVCKGVSAKTFGDDIALIQGYDINREAITEYKKYFADFDFGILAYANKDGAACQPKPGDDKVVDIVFDNMANDYIEVKLTGVPADNQDVALVFCIYVTEGEKFYYIDDGAMAESVVGKSYNDITE